MKELTGVYKQIWDNASAVHEELIEIADYIHDNPELGREEFKASRLLADKFEKYGFQVTREAFGMPTAFLAEYAPHPEGGPVIGICAEYDALPGMGHACGHHVIASGCLGAAIALKPIMDTIGGTLRVYGTPAEESTGDKMILIRDGVFDDVDFVMQNHPNDRTMTKAQFKAMHIMDFIFHGLTAHSARCPEQGINALNGVLLGMTAVEYLRNYVRKDVSIAGYVTSGGVVFSNIPDYASCRYAIMADNKFYLEKVVQRVINCFKGAELATGATLEIQDGMILDNNVNVPTYDRVMLEHAIEAGAERVLDPVSKAATDFSSVTLRIPGSRIDIAYAPIGVGPHNPGFEAAGKTELAHKAILQSAYAMAATCYDLFTDKKLGETIKAEHKAEVERLMAEA